MSVDHKKIAAILGSEPEPAEADRVGQFLRGKGVLQCIYPDCSKVRGKSRGLCSMHYSRAQLRVKRGETTWAVLEAAGLALRANPRYQRTGRGEG